MRKAFVAFSMLLLTAGAANAGGLVTRHQSSLQHTVDPTRTITSRTANSYSISGSGVTLDLEVTPQEMTRLLVDSMSFPMVRCLHGRFLLPPLPMEGHSLSPIVLSLVTLLMQLEQTALYIHQVLLVVTAETTNQEPLIVDTGLPSQVLLKVLVQV